MSNRTWLLKHLGEAEYARDQARAQADIASLNRDFRARREWVSVAWRMRAIVRRAKSELELPKPKADAGSVA